MSPASSFDGLRFEIADGVAHLTLARPERGNAIDLALATSLNEVAVLCDEDPAVRCLLVDAEGKWFSSGGDLAGLGASRAGSAAFVKRTTTPLHSALSRFARMNAPMVVAMAGGAIGAGVGLVAAADFVLATPRVRFVSGYTAIGMTADAGLSYFLPRRVGTRAAADYLLRARTWTAEDALHHGLVTEVVSADHLGTRAAALAAELATGPTLAYGEIKNLLLSSWDTPLEAQLELEARALARATRTRDGWHGIESGLAQTAPTFEGQ